MAAMKTLAAIAAMSVLTLTLGGCTTPAVNKAPAHPDPAHNARNSLDW